MVKVLPLLIHKFKPDKFVINLKEIMDLLKTFKKNGLQLNNRVIMAPLTRTRIDNDNLAPTELNAEYYKQRASAGLIISEGTPISEDAFGYTNVPGIYSPEQIEGWKLVTSAVHKEGGKIFAQIWHVGRISHPAILNGRSPLAPSAINANFHAYTNMGFAKTGDPREMTEEDIQSTIQDFQQATLNAIEAGFDGVELHAANGYLFHQFFSKGANVRTDAYGGSIENRSRFLFDVLEKISEKINLSKVGVRLSPDLNKTLGIVKDEESDKLFEYLINKLNDYGIAYLHLSGFSADPEKKAENILATAKRYREIYRGNFMINGGFDRNSANQAIEAGVADLISFGELWIANPDLVTRFHRDGPYNEVRKELYYGQSEQGYIDYPTLGQ